ncbi:MAG: trimeric intracellular cation channel family protein [Gemmatimonadaceae bacterium]
MIADQQVLIGTFLVVLDLVGTFVFALSGATAGVRRQLDLFGVLVLAFATANAGGITRDVLIGAIPPAGLSDWRYIFISALAGLAVFTWTWTRAHPTLSSRIAEWPRVADRLGRIVLLLDAAGLALFAVSGALKALAFHLAPVASVLLGVMTGVGGGVVRDLLVNQVPTILRRTELYAVAALAGATVVVSGRALALPTPLVAVAGASLCFVLRLLAIRRRWRLPVAPLITPPSTDA